MSILNTNALKLVFKEVVNSRTIFLDCSCFRIYFWPTIDIQRGKMTVHSYSFSTSQKNVKEAELFLIKFSLVYVIKTKIDR